MAEFHTSLLSLVQTNDVVLKLVSWLNFLSPFPTLILATIPLVSVLIVLPPKIGKWPLLKKTQQMSSPNDIQILFPSQAFRCSKSSIPLQFQCSCVSQINTNHCQSISTLLHSLHPQCPRLTPFPKAKVSISHHILAKRNDLLFRKLRHCKCVLGLRDQDSEEGTDPRWSPVTEGKDESYERAAWPKRHLPVVLGISSPYPASASLLLCTANHCCCSSSLEQRGRNLNWSVRRDSSERNWLWLKAWVRPYSDLDFTVVLHRSPWCFLAPGAPLLLGT